MQSDITSGLMLVVHGFLQTNTKMDSSNDDIEIIDEKFTTKNNESSNKTETESDNEDKPSGVECLNRCKQFAEITGTDTALAMFYLQDKQWDLQKGLNAYYQATNNKESKVVACFDVEQLDDDERRKKPKTSDESSSSDVILDTSAQEDEQVSSENNDKNDYFKIMSWNIDGLDKSNLESRTFGVASKILDQKPDIIFLQEVIEITESILSDKLNKLYNFTSGSFSESSNRQLDLIGYYTLILTKKKTCQVTSKNIIWFNNSVMGRNLLQVKLVYKENIKVCAMTAHLESTADHSKQRVEQLKRSFEEMLEQDKDCLVFFGGDLNLRDSEVSAIGGLPEKIYDVWESTGSRKECLYTWDCSRNTNLKMNSRFKPRCRFDRLYYRPLIDSDTKQNKSEYTLMPVYFELEGLEKLKSCGRFCSDHWAIQSYCQIEQNISI